MIKQIDNQFMKRVIREKIWRMMETRDIPIFPRPVYGRIPSFKGQSEAASKLFSTNEWREARLIKINPDAPQQPIRKKGLEEGKIVLVASPRLSMGFIMLDPRFIPKNLYSEASKITGFMRLGRKLSLDELMSIGKVDFIVEGSVAVNPFGERIGKGEGYGELEYAILRELGLVGEETPIATTVHDIQVLDERLPQDPWDVPIDMIVTPTRIIRCKRGLRPKGILWDLLSEEKKREIPLLIELEKRQKK